MLILNDYKYLLISYSLPRSISALHWITSYNVYTFKNPITAYRSKKIKLFGNVPRTTGHIYPVMIIDEIAKLQTNIIQ